MKSLKKVRYLMDMVKCPHCKSHRIITSRIPKDVVAVMPCPSCNELSVLFRNKVIPINRRILEEGTKEERTQHLAQVITEFLEAGILPFQDGSPGFESAIEMPAKGMPDFDSASDALQSLEPISDKEAEKFGRVDLKCLDDAAYFKRHFGGV
ncbi:MAG: hypothetical protein L3K26_02460 [Candidatus Hydrogenedentes bacterium]|nr:hypothetical protein [Candidatus Hydrogenedentota bacterium]